MNTPAHAVASLLILGDRERPETGLPLVVGALLPDVPIVVFYAYQRLWRGMPEDWIWSEGYRLPGWQAFFDVFNSLPLILIGLLAARALASVRSMAFFASTPTRSPFCRPASVKALASLRMRRSSSPKLTRRAVGISISAGLSGAETAHLAGILPIFIQLPWLP